MSEWNFGEVILQALNNEKNRAMQREQAAVQDRQFNQSLSQNNRHFDVQMGQNKEQFNTNLAMALQQIRFRQETEFPEEQKQHRATEKYNTGMLGVQQGYFGITQEKWQRDKAFEEAQNAMARLMINPPANGQLAPTLQAAAANNPFIGRMAPVLLPALAAAQQHDVQRIANVQNVERGYSMGEPMGRITLADRALNIFAPKDVMNITRTPTEMNPQAREMRARSAYMQRVAGIFNGTTPADANAMMSSIGGPMAPVDYTSPLPDSQPQPMIPKIGMAAPVPMSGGRVRMQDQIWNQASSLFGQ